MHYSIRVYPREFAADKRNRGRIALSPSQPGLNPRSSEMTTELIIAFSRTSDE